MASTQNMAYRRSGNKGTLKLSGDIDICTAVELKDFARRALADTKARSLCVEMSRVERLDIAAIQILCALKRTFGGADREFEISGLAPELVGRLSAIGITL